MSWIPPVLMGGLILAVAVWPLHISPGRALRGVGQIELLQLSVLDPVRNVILFLPLGLVWPGATRESMKRLLIGAALLSLTIETIQIVLPGRIVSLQDILANSAGGAAGLALRVGTVRAARWWNTVGTLRAAAAAGGLWGVTLLGAHVVDYGMRQLRWPADHDLVVGNRDTRRAWCVEVERLEMRIDGQPARNLSWTAVGDDPCPGGQRRTAQLPAGTSRAVAGGAAVSFTLTATALRTDRGGPARILEIARPDGREEGSLLVAQEREDLEVRVRRPLQGTEGRRPYYHIPDVFAPGRPTEIAVQLAPDSVVVRAGAASVVHRHRLTSQWWMLFDRVVRWRPYRTRGTIAEVLFWFVVTAPAALALGLARSVATRPWIGLAGCGALWWLTRVPGVLPASSMAGIAALALPAAFLCLWFGVGALLAVGPTRPRYAPAIHTATRGTPPATRAAPAAGP